MITSMRAGINIVGPGALASVCENESPPRVIDTRYQRFGETAAENIRARQTGNYITVIGDASTTSDGKENTCMFKDFLERRHGLIKR